MYGSAITLAKQVNASEEVCDVFLVSDMIDLALFKSLLDLRFQGVPMVLYFHENQLTYPWSETDPDVSLKRDHHYGFTNISSALVADQIVFNSKYHQESFLAAAMDLIKQLPDHRPISEIKALTGKSSVVAVGIDIPDNVVLPSNELPIILWNHRWEYDKDPDLFFNTLIALKAEGLRFNLIVLGESTSKQPAIFAHAREALSDQIIHFGYAESRQEYTALLQKADVLPVSGIQDFFGLSVVEAIANGVTPLLPQRLAYPEHLSPEEYPMCFYQTPEAYKARLAQMIQEFPQSKIQVSKEVEKYGWDQVAKTLDSLVDSVC